MEGEIIPEEPKPEIVKEIIVPKPIESRSIDTSVFGDLQYEE